MKARFSSVAGKVFYAKGLEVVNSLIKSVLEAQCILTSFRDIQNMRREYPNLFMFSLCLSFLSFEHCGLDVSCGGSPSDDLIIDS